MGEICPNIVAETSSSSKCKKHTPLSCGSTASRTGSRPLLYVCHPHRPVEPTSTRVVEGHPELGPGRADGTWISHVSSCLLHILPSPSCKVRLACVGRGCMTGRCSFLLLAGRCSLRTEA